MKNYFVSLVLASCTILHAQDKKPYQLFDKNGKKVSFEKVVKASLKTEVVLFGEFHNNPICHWLQLELTKDVASKSKIVLGAEMIEADNQKQLNAYLADEMNQKQLDSTARLWSNYKTDYKPLVDFAKANKLPFIATNIPRRYASMVHKKGFEALEALTDEEKSWMAPLPMPYDKNLPGYTQMMTMMGEHTSPNMPKAQASKDATMAHFIIKNRQPNSVFIHFNGSFHSDNFDGINWYLRKYHPEVKIVTIATVEQNEVDDLEKEHLNKADFILVIDADMTKTY
ncbi:ChaN family lipoprotein [Flavobacterium sp.]|jgi:uncharacterized iron-regulated protein|uniref:ChaN family lipoprotein n=1 Tax=Flavobacterium sp. TaxID=239 RepID=UPI0037C03234